MMPFDQQCRVERERREGREPAQQPCRQEQPHMLADPRAEGEITGEQANCERSNEIDDQCAEWKAEAEQLRRADVDPVATRAANSGPEEYDQIKHRRSLTSGRTIFRSRHARVLPRSGGRGCTGPSAA